MSTKKWKEEHHDDIKKYRRTWYYKNRERAYNKTRERKIIIREWFKDLKQNLKCNRCDENHPATLHFHHIDPKKKIMSLAMMINHAWSKEKILLEMEKCEVLCANCHAKEHYNGDYSISKDSTSLGYV
ncbi:MAG: hypothetical protein AABY07_01335 [Nanoarchaeota archaeon]